MIVTIAVCTATAVAAILYVAAGCSPPGSMIRESVAAPGSHLPSERDRSPQGLEATRRSRAPAPRR